MWGGTYAPAMNINEQKFTRNEKINEANTFYVLDIVNTCMKSLLYLSKKSIKF